jgi:hypothetical protein
MNLHDSISQGTEIFKTQSPNSLMKHSARKHPPPARTLPISGPDVVSAKSGSYPEKLPQAHEVTTPVHCYSRPHGTSLSSPAAKSRGIYPLVILYFPRLRGRRVTTAKWIKVNRHHEKKNLSKSGTFKFYVRMTVHLL